MIIGYKGFLLIVIIELQLFAPVAHGRIINLFTTSLVTGMCVICVVIE